jgi:integrase
MKLKIKPNGMYFLEVDLPTPEMTLKRTRVSFDTRDRTEAEAQLHTWKLGTHKKHPNQGYAITPKGLTSSSVSRTHRSNEMTIERLLNMCWDDDKLWGKSKSQKTIKSNIKLLSQRIGTLHPREVTSEVLLELEKEMSVTYAPASIQRKFSMLQTALRAARTYKFNDEAIVLNVPVFPSIKVENFKDRVLDEHEEKVMFECIEARMILEPHRSWFLFKWYVRILLVTGFRRAEALKLGANRVRHIRKGDKEYTTLFLKRYETKNDKPHEVPIPKAISDIIPTLNTLSGDERWFPLGGRLWQMLVNIKADCLERSVDISDVGLHTMRHTCITRLCRDGKLDLLRISKWANHSSVVITAKRYAHLLSHDLVDGLEAFE